MLHPRAGDLTLGVVIGVLLLCGSWAGRLLLAGPETARQMWLGAIYIQLGPSDLLQSSPGILSAFLFIIFSQELCFRGSLQESLSTSLGQRSGWIICSLLDAGTFLGTIFTMRVPGVGPNPLLFLGVLLCALVLGFTRQTTQRLLPGLIAHLVFAYFSIAQFRLPGL
ncbi:MAG: CPBP family glutamic-type intramembrane protease [Polyangiaceae bacterium]|nr:CPBP family glutamic-type intramembrane protease [Polyangiaceae bacterium]